MEGVELASNLFDVRLITLEQMLAAIRLQEHPVPIPPAVRDNVVEELKLSLFEIVFEKELWLWSHVFYPTKTSYPTVTVSPVPRR